MKRAYANRHPMHPRGPPAMKQIAQNADRQRKVVGLTERQPALQEHDWKPRECDRMYSHVAEETDI